MAKDKAAALRGKVGEDAVCVLLNDKGARILERNYRVKGGEIDIISLSGEFLVFTEVKTRKFGAFDDGTAAMGKAKMRRIIATAERFVEEREEFGEFYRRFDTAYVTVTTDRFPQVLEIEYFEGDFSEISLE